MNTTKFTQPKRYYFPNTEITDEKIPFGISITSALAVYIVKGGTMYTPDAYCYFEKTRVLAIEHEGFNIKVLGRGTDGKPVYKIKAVK